MHLLQDKDSEVRKFFVVQFLARMMVDVDWPKTFCGVMKSTFVLMEKLTPTTIKFEHEETLMLSWNNLCILKKEQYGVFLRPTLSLDRISFAEITANGIQTCSIIG